MTANKTNFRAAALLNFCWPAIAAACWLTGCGKPAATPEGEHGSPAAAVSQATNPADDAWIKQAEARLQQDREARDEWVKQDGAKLPEHLTSEPPPHVVTNPADPLALPRSTAPRTNKSTADYLKDFEPRPVGRDASSDGLQGNPGSQRPDSSAAPKASFDESLREVRNWGWLASRAALDSKGEVLRGMEIKPIEFTEAAICALEIMHDPGDPEVYLAIQSPPGMQSVAVDSSPHGDELKVEKQSTQYFSFTSSSAF